MKAPTCGAGDFHVVVVRAFVRNKVLHLLGGDRAAIKKSRHGMLLCRYRREHNWSLSHRRPFTVADDTATLRPIIKRGELISGTGRNSRATRSGGGPLPSLQYPVNARPADAERLGDGCGREAISVMPFPSMRRLEGLPNRRSLSPSLLLRRGHFSCGAANPLAIA